MVEINYDNQEVSFQYKTPDITAVVGQENLEQVFQELLYKRDTYFSTAHVGVISQSATYDVSLTLGDLMSRQFKIHKKVSRKRSMQAVTEILRFLAADEITDVEIIKLSELQRAHAWLARSIALRPEVVVSWSFFSTMTLGVRATIQKNIVDIKTELGVGFLLFEKRLEVIENIADTVFNFHPVNAPIERPHISITPSSPSVAKTSPDEISGLDFVSS